MIVEESKIAEIILSEEPDFIKEAKAKQVILDVHVNGRGVAEYMRKIESYENEEQYKLRKKFTISNKHVISNILRPVDKVFTAKGGSEVYNIKGGDITKEEFKNKLSNIRFDKSIRAWIHSVQTNKYYSDPAGLVFFEWKDGETYPTIKSIQCIENYKAEGRNVEWVCFEGVKRKGSDGTEIPGEFVRFVDDAYDYMFHKNGDKLTLLEDERYDNPWGKVPAIVNSDILNDQLRYSDSPIDIIVELADKYVRTNSIKNIHEYLHGFPFFWMYDQKCSSCNGFKEIDGKQCTACRGTGYAYHRDVSDVNRIKVPRGEDPKIAPDIAGYVVPPLDIPKEQREELNWIWGMMHYTMWGKDFEQGQNNQITATAALLNVQPEVDRVSLFSRAFEDMEQKMTDIIGKFYFPDAYESCSINYGRRFLMEPADKVWEKYLNAKEKMAPKSTLDSLLNEYYQSLYANDSQMLGIMLKGMRLEPFVHDDIMSIQSILTSDLLKRKLFFNEWWKTLDEQIILLSDDEKLNDLFTNYLNAIDYEKSQDV